MLDIVEAAYAIEQGEELWLRGIARACRPYLDRGFGLAAFVFRHDMAGGGPPTMVKSELVGVPEGLAKEYPMIYRNMPDELKQRPFAAGPCTTASQMLGMGAEFAAHPYLRAHAQRHGINDAMWITAAEPTGWGCGLHAGKPRVGWAAPKTVQRWSRVASHLAAALRLRHRMSSGSTRAAVEGKGSAIYTPDGRLAHVEPSTCDGESVQALRRAVLTVERARRTRRRRSIDGALADWQALVNGRWSLLDHFESDGKRFIVARENEPCMDAPTLLSERERQVVAFAALGHDNKAIAYDLGIAQSTVRVLMSRAAAKLGVRRRSEIIDRFRDVMRR